MQSTKDGISEASVEKNDMNMMDAPDESELQNNPYIMSYQIPTGQVSFIDSRQAYNKIAPPPKYFSDEYMRENFNLPTEKHIILSDFDFPDAGGMICTN